MKRRSVFWQTLFGKFAAALLIACFSYGESSAQYTFVETIGRLDNSQSVVDRGASSIQTSDGGFLTVAESAALQGGSTLYIVKTDDQGAVQWSRTIDGGSELDKVIAAGGGHALYLMNGLVQSWGVNINGQLGNGTTSMYQPMEAPTLEFNSILALAGGQAFSLAVTSDQMVHSWGANFYGQLGNGTTTDASTPQTVLDWTSQPLSGVVCVAAGGIHDVHPTHDGHSLALTSAGSVYAFGSDYSGQLGDNDGGTLQRTLAWPVRESASSVLRNVVAIGAGSGHSLAAKDDGSVWTWGENASAQVSGDGIPTASGPGQTAQRVAGIAGAVAVDGGDDHSIALLQDGSVVYWGSNYSPVPPTIQAVTTMPGLPSITAIASGAAHCVALDNNGRVWTWGTHDLLQLGRTVAGTYDFTPGLVQTPGGTDLENIVAIAAGNFFSMAVDRDGNIYTWGDQEIGNALPFATFKTQTDFRRPSLTQSTFRVSAVREVLDAHGANDGYAILGMLNDVYSTYYDYYLIKIREVGSSVIVEWSKKYGSVLHEFASDFEQVFDGNGTPDGFIITGKSVTDPGTLVHSWANLIRVENDGSQRWARRYQLHMASTGSQRQLDGYSVEQVFDPSGQPDGFIFGGSVFHKGISQHIPDPYLFKTRIDGAWQWSQVYSYPTNCYEPAIRQTQDNGFVFSARLGSSSENEQLALMKTDAQGNRQWDWRFRAPLGVQEYDLAQWDMVEVLDGSGSADGYAMVGSLEFNDEPYECALYRFNPTGNLLWTQKYGDLDGRSLQQTNDLGFIIGGSSGSLTNPLDILLVKTDASGSAGAACSESVELREDQVRPRTLEHTPVSENWIGARDYFPNIIEASEEVAYRCSPRRIKKAGVDNNNFSSPDGVNSSASATTLRLSLGGNPVPRGETIIVNCVTAIPGDYELRLQDATGRTVIAYTQTLSAGANTISLSSRTLAEGAYFLSLRKGEHRSDLSVLVSQ